MFRFSNPNINFKSVLRVIGLLLMIESVFTLIPLGVTLYYREPDWKAFLITFAVTLGCGAAMAFGIRGRAHGMGKREGFLLTALVWVFFSAFGMLPFMLLELKPYSVSDAFFEAMSGFTTTGASIMTSISHLGHGALIWRAVMQWLGGMGIILFTLAVVPMLNKNGGVQMFNAEVTGITHDKLRPRISQTAKSLWLMYFCLTVVAIILLMLSPMGKFDAVCYALSTVSTGGFTTSDVGLNAWDSDYIKVVVMIFMFMGGVNFTLLYRALHRDFKAVWHNDVFRIYIALIFAFYAMLVVNIFILGKAETWRSVTLDPLFQVVSMISTTGYELPELSSWGMFPLVIMIFLMFFGACAGSTTGGAKLDRLIILLQNSRNEIDRCIYPNNVLTVRMNHKVIPHDVVNKVIAFLCLYVLIIVVIGTILCAMGLNLNDAFFSTFGCISNDSGPSASFDGSGVAYHLIPDAGKWLLALTMMTGRLELFTVLLLFSPSFWHK